MKSDTSISSEELEDSDLELNEPQIYQRARGKNKGGIKQICPTINSSKFQDNNLLVSSIATTTNTQSKPIIKTSEKIMKQQTLEPLKQIPFQTLICSVEDFLARHSVLLEKGEVSKIPEVHCFLRLQESLKLKDLKLFSSKMSKGYSITTKGKLSVSSFKRFQNWGMMFNGWFLTANFSEFPRTEKGYSLSEIEKILNI